MTRQPEPTPGLERLRALRRYSYRCQHRDADGWTCNARAGRVAVLGLELVPVCEAHLPGGRA